LAAFAAALLSKESAFVNIALVALVSLWIERPRLLTVVRRVFPYVALGVAFVALRRFAVGALTLAEPPPFIDNPLAHVGSLARLATALVVLGDYGSVLVLPLRLSADDSFDQVPVVHSLADPRLVGATAVMLALAVALVAARRRAPVLPFAALFFVAAIALTSNVCFPIGTIKAERMLYLPSFSCCLAGGWLLRRWTGRARGTRPLVVALLLLGLAGRTWVRNADWKDNYTLFTKTVETSPGSARAHANAAAVHGAAGDLDFAEEHFRAAVAIYPQFGPALVGLAQVSEVRGAREDAIHWYSEAIRLDPRNLEPYLRLGELLLQAGDAHRAEEVYRAGLGRVPNHPLLLLGVASSLARQGDRSRANEFLARAEANPSLPPDIARRARALRRELQGP
ncbi:MAG TPA: tetratricopeptide repeat protein, partial [Verrucomicrobiae bacterium]|nr:tetratricopeptide repeat protein [Verrucomicrobiae bacterium]